MAEEQNITSGTLENKTSENPLFQNTGEMFQQFLLEQIPSPALQKRIQTDLLDFQGFQDSLENQIQKYTCVLEFSNMLKQLAGQKLFNEIVFEDVTLPFAIVGEMRKTVASSKENVKPYEDAMTLFLIVIFNYYALKSKGKFKYNVLVNSLFLQGKESLEQFKEKLHPKEQEGLEVPFPVKMRQSQEEIKEALLLPQSFELNDEQSLLHMKCLLAIRKVHLDYLLNLFSVLQKIDTRTGNERVGTVCVEKAILLFTPLLTTLQEQIEQFRKKHRHKLETCYDPGETEESKKLKLWFDILDIHFEHDPDIRKLKLYVSTLDAPDSDSWAKLMNQRFRDFPAVLTEIEAIQQNPLDYQGVHDFAIHAYRKVPAIQQKIKDGMKIIESMQERFNTFVKSTKAKKGTDSIPDFTDVYDLFHTLQEGREGSSFIRDDEKTFLKRSDNKTGEMELFVKLSHHKQEMFLMLLFVAMENPSYVQSIVWQLYYLEDTSVFTKLVNFLSSNRSKSEALNRIFLCFSIVLKHAETELQALKEAEQKELEQKKKQHLLEKKMEHLQQAKGRFEGETIISDEHVKTKEAKQRKEERDRYYDGVKRLTSVELEDYLKERRAKFQIYLEELREKRKAMNKKQLKVSKSTEAFMEAELKAADALTPTENQESGEAVARLDTDSINKFEGHTFEALDGYEESCPAQGPFKKEYFQNRKNEIKGMLDSLRDQVGQESTEGDAAVRIMDSVHSVMETVERNMQNLAGDLPADAHEKLKELLQKEEKSFNDMMEKEFEILVRGTPAAYTLKAFIILPIPAKQKMIAIKTFQFSAENELSEAEYKSLESFLYYRSNFATSHPLDVLDKEGKVQTIKLANYLWYESLLYQTISFNFGNESENITLQDLYGLPLKPIGEHLFTQHNQLVEKILTETQKDDIDDDFKEKIIRDIKNKNFETNLASRYQGHSETYDLFPEGTFDENVFNQVIEWYHLRKEDRQLNYFELRKG